MKIMKALESPAPDDVCWTRVDEDDLSITSVADVPGGWLIRETSQLISLSGTASVALCFVPFPHIGPVT